MTYADKLKDPRWLNRREEFIDTKRTECEGIAYCDDCVEDTTGPLHVHHRLYRKNAEPWEYDDEELRLLCAGCHQRLHDTEKRIRALVLTVSPHVCYDIDDLLDELETLPQGELKIVLARARREAINLKVKRGVFA